MKKMAKFNPLFTILVSVSLYYRALCQSQAPAPSVAGADCNGIYVSYRYINGWIIHPIQPTNQPYRFESTLTVRNNGLDDLKAWRVFVGFQNDEVLVSASNAVLVGGSSLPALVGHGVVFAGFPTTDLKSAIETAGDTRQMEAVVQLVGTQFGVKSSDSDAPMPANLTLANDGYLCPQPNKTIGSNELQMCCIKDENFKSNITVGDQFLARQQGDLVIMYDVIRMYDTNYLAQVTLSNHNPLGRIDNWKLTWEWMRQEFIFSMKGAYPEFMDTSDCVFGPQGQFYQGMDFAQALSCDKKPTIQDLPPTMANNSDRGKIPFCCRNGTLLPPSIDPAKSTSVFQMQVFKMPPDVNRTEVLPPQNWGISGTTMNTDYQCGSPDRVSPSQFPDPSGLPSFSSAFASWQVVCNKTEPKTPKCCVSFSSFFNESVVPCKTCACGCSGPNAGANTCSATGPALLERPQDLFVPFENRTEKTVEWNRLQRRAVPEPLPCGDNCGVSIHWHLNTEFKDGWSARVTLFNWGEVNFADWFAAVQLDKAVPGFEAVYSFNGTALPGLNSSNNTIIMYGLEGSNFLLGENDGKNPKKDPRVPGMQQSVISFKKKPTPGIDVAARDGFPTKVIFNGMECSLPEMVPSNGHRVAAMTSVLGLLIALVFLLM